jgi:hypothetical protein
MPDVLWISDDRQEVPELCRMLHYQVLRGDGFVRIGAKGFSGLERAFDLCRLLRDMELVDVRFWDVQKGWLNTSAGRPVPAVVWTLQRSGDWSKALSL